MIAFCEKLKNSDSSKSGRRDGIPDGDGLQSWRTCVDVPGKEEPELVPDLLGKRR